MSKVVVGVDGSREAVAALRWAVAEARLRGVRLVAVHAARRSEAPRGTDSDADHGAPRGAGAAVLEHALAEVRADVDELTVEPRLLADHPAHGLIATVDPEDLLVVGARGSGGFGGLRLGGTAEHCARLAPCPVVVVGDAPDRRAGRILVGVDGSKDSQRALAWAVAEAQLRGAAVDVVSVYLPYRASAPFGAEFMEVASPGWERRFHRRALQTAEEAIAAVAAPDTSACTARVGVGHPAEVLADLSGDADLLVVGHRGLGGFAGVLLGSVSRQVLHHARCPVVVVHG